MANPNPNKKEWIDISKHDGIVVVSLAVIFSVVMLVAQSVSI